MNQYPPPPPSPGVPPPYPEQAPRTEGLATASLIAGILSLSCLGCIGGLPAIICGHIARGRIARSNGTLDGAGMALAGLIMGYVSIVLTVAVTIGYFIFFAKALPQIQSGTAPVVISAQTAQLATALDQYKAQAGAMPALAASNGEVVDTAALVGILGGKNAAGVTYYEPGKDGVQVNGLPVDLWFQPLRIAIDLNGDGFVQVGAERVPGIVAVWSTGPNKKDDSGGGDDVVSWRENPSTTPLEH